MEDEEGTRFQGSKTLVQVGYITDQGSNPRSL